MPRVKQIDIDVDVNRAIEQARLSLAESQNDILRRLLLRPSRPRGVATPPPPASRRPSGGPRRRGLWTVELCGERTAAGSLKDAYRATLEGLAERFPDFLDKFSRETGRSRRFVARSPTQLYANSPHLADKHAECLADGWFFDTNLSTEQVSQRVRIAAHLCGLLYGKDVRLLDNLREI